MNAMAQQPCALCGRETAPGSPLFVGRRRGFNAKSEAVLVCAACVADSEARAPRGNSSLSTIALADIFLSPPA